MEVARIGKNAGLKRAVCYGIGRVAFIERGILNNVNHKALATLVGHTDTKMIDTTYARRLGDFSEQLTVIAGSISAAPLVKKAV